MKKTVLLRSDVAGEDMAYTICAVKIDVDKITIDQLQQQAVTTMDEFRQQVDGEYEDYEPYIKSLEQAGFTVVDPPEEVVVRY